MTEQREGQYLSEPERRFNRRWRELIDEAGGQQRVHRRLGWSTSTVSRGYTGETLPTDERVRQLCDHLKLGPAERAALWEVLESARPARLARRRDPAVALTAGQLLSAGQFPPAGGIAVPLGSGGAAGPGPGAADVSPADTGRASSRMSRRRRLSAIGTGVAVVIVIAATVLFWQPWGKPEQSRGATLATTPVAKGGYPGIGVKTVVIQRSSLTPALAAAFRTGRTAGAARVAGYVFRNVEDTGLCLTAADTGPDAGQNHDRVEIAVCDGAASQVWIPLQWETGGSRFSQLVNLRYQSKCLNAQNKGGLRNGHPTMLWNCYKSANESWDFADWVRKVKTDGQAYPIFVESARQCLDADKYDFRPGDGVNLWSQYKTENQFWS